MLPCSSSELPSTRPDPSEDRPPPELLGLPAPPLLLLLLLPLPLDRLEMVRSRGCVSSCGTSGASGVSSRGVIKAAGHTDNASSSLNTCGEGGRRGAVGNSKAS